MFIFLFDKFSIMLLISYIRRLLEILDKLMDITIPDALHKALKDRIIKEAVRAA